MKSAIIFIAIILNGTLLSAQTKFHSPNSLSVSVVMEDGVPHVYWNTSKEINTSFFIIERANTGQPFSSINTVKASGYSQFPKSYLYVDQAAPSPYCRYRITLVMMDGTRITAEPSNKKKLPELLIINALSTE